MKPNTSRRQRTFLQPSEIGRPHYRSKNPILAGYLYQFRQPFWDCYMVAITTALPNLLLFQQPQGGNYASGGVTSVQKTLYHTNMTTGGALPSPEKLFVRTISFSMRSDILLADAQRLVFDTVLRFLVSQRSFLDLHAYKASCAGGLYGNTSGALSNGMPIGDPKNAFIFSGALGEVVEQLQTFAVQVNPTLVSDASANTTYTTATTGGTGVNAFVHLDGLLSRAVL